MIDTIIDVNHNNSINFTKLREAGIVAIIHKATEGETFKDSKYKTRKKQALDLGFLWGAYHFSSGRDPSSQVSNFLSVEDAEDPNILIALDWEDSTSGANMTLAQAKQFVSEVHERTGRFPLLYGGSLIRENVTEEDKILFENCPLWFARFRETPIGIPEDTWRKATLHQYTDGDIGPEPRKTPGASGADRNRFDGTVKDLRAAWPFTFRSEQVRHRARTARSRG
jgi:lysozyme